MYNKNPWFEVEEDIMEKEPPYLGIFNFPLKEVAKNLPRPAAPFVAHTQTSTMAQTTEKQPTHVQTLEIQRNMSSDKKQNQL